MNVDKKTSKIAIISLIIALVWSYPAIQSVAGAQNVPTDVVVSVLIRTLIVFAFIRCFMWLKKRK